MLAFVSQCIHRFQVQLMKLKLSVVCGEVLATCVSAEIQVPIQALTAQSISACSSSFSLIAGFAFQTC